MPPSRQENGLPGSPRHGTFSGVTESWALFDRLADSYDGVIPFFAEHAAVWSC
jgi:hypothetical protein